MREGEDACTRGKRRWAAVWMQRRIESGAGLAGGPSAGYNRGVPACIAKVLFFGRLKELVGVSEDAYELRDGVAIEQIFADFQTKIVPGLTLWNHPHFHAWFSAASAPPSVLRRSEWMRLFVRQSTLAAAP